MDGGESRLKDRFRGKKGERKITRQKDIKRYKETNTETKEVAISK